MPDRRELQQQFAQLSYAQRRAIVKAVNGGRAVEIRKHAPMAIGVAQRQMRFWRWAWLLGPFIGVVQLVFTTPEIAVTNAVLATAVLFLMAWILIRRAQRSIVANIAVMEGRIGDLPRRKRRAPSTSEQHSEAADSPHDGPDEDAGTAEPAPRPPQPRGKKRRRR